MTNVLLLYGGQSGEHEVSCVSAEYLAKNIQLAGFNVFPVYIDRTGLWHLQDSVGKTPKANLIRPCFLKKSTAGIQLVNEQNAHDVHFAFPIIHGTRGEDGSLQGFFEIIGLPYAGAGVLSSALCMDKSLTRMAFAAAGIPQVKYLTVDKYELNDYPGLLNKILSSLNFPVFVKPCNMGSSVGVSKVDSEKDLRHAIEQAFAFDDHILVEEGRPVRELEVGITGNYPDYDVTGIGEIEPSHNFYSYKAKYEDPDGAKLQIKADIADSLRDEIRALARAAFKSVRGDGFARIDFFLDRETGKVLINEINTLPGFTPISMFPRLWAAAMVDGPLLVTKIIDLGKSRAEAIRQLHR